MKNLFISFLLISLLLVFFKTSVLAKSNYVLPYPSSMPGGISYKLHLIFEQISKYWYFGDFGQFDYNLKMADKYLVEAKILFEYKQYLLGYKSLQKSDSYFSNILPSLIKAEEDNKDVAQERSILREAVRKHVETLERMRIDSPAIFDWQPEKALPTTLDIKGAINKAINIRKNDL